MRISDWSSDVCSSDLVGRALARKFAQAAERDLDVAGAEFLGVVEILELALFPDFQRALVLALAADPHAFGIIARIAEGRGAAGADPPRRRSIPKPLRRPRRLASRVGPGNGRGSR